MLRGTVLISAPPPPTSTLFPYTTLFRSRGSIACLPLARSIQTCIQLFTGGVNEERRASQNSRSEEHTSELQSRFEIVCRLLLEKKKNRVLPLCYGFSCLSAYNDFMTKGR